MKKDEKPLILTTSRITRSVGHPEGPARGSFDLRDPNTGRVVGRATHTDTDTSITRAIHRIAGQARAGGRSIRLRDGSILRPDGSLIEPEDNTQHNT